MMTTEPKYRGLTERQWERLVYGTCHVLIQQALDNGELEYADNDEYWPPDLLFDDSTYSLTSSKEKLFYYELKKRIERTVLSDLGEEAAKRDG